MNGWMGGYLVRYWALAVHRAQCIWNPGHSVGVLSSLLACSSLTSLSPPPRAAEGMNE